jgi:hypothetical protein
MCMFCAINFIFILYVAFLVKIFYCFPQKIFIFWNCFSFFSKNPIFNIPKFWIIGNVFCFSDKSFLKIVKFRHICFCFKIFDSICKVYLLSFFTNFFVKFCEIFVFLKTSVSIHKHFAKTCTKSVSEMFWPYIRTSWKKNQNRMFWTFFVKLPHVSQRYFLKHKRFIFCYKIPKIFTFCHFCFLQILCSTSCKAHPI